MTFRTVPVMMYHHVSPVHDMITITPEHFASHLAWLARAGYTTLNAAQFAGFLAGVEVPEKSIVLTFDDGYLDNWVYGHPLLQRYGMTAIMFLITGHVHDGPARPYAGQGLALPATPAHKECEAAMFAGDADHVMVRWSEVQVMRAAGTFDFHSHTHTHTRWDKLYTDAARKTDGITQDLVLSRAALQRHLGEVSDHLCWPQGYFDADYVAAAQSLGFRHLYTTDPRGQNQPGTDPAHILRITAKDEPGNWLRRRVWLSRHRVLGPLYDKIRY